MTLSKPQLFGTDGVRGVAGEPPLDRQTVFRLGRALGIVLARNHADAKPRILLGRDTRESGEEIARTLAAGLKAQSVEVTYAGVLTTPGVALLTREQGFDAGIVISASHNPYLDNGFKALATTGTKLGEATEIEIERALETLDDHGRAPEVTPLEVTPGMVKVYADRLFEMLGGNMPGKPLRIVLDCANGAASEPALMLLEMLGASGVVLNASPNGRNINDHCGSLHPEGMAHAVKDARADFGVAFDGDADRAIFATREGRIADGDAVLYAAALDRKARGNLKGGRVVGTLMSNLGLEQALAREGIGLARASVGDKYVLEEMLRSGSNLGGEPSGHIIFRDVSNAGDGLITLLEVVGLISRTNRGLGELIQGVSKFPQIIRNVRVREKLPLESFPAVRAAMDRCRSELAEGGRLIVRYSGTEPLARVMVEAPDSELVERHAASIARAIESELGAV